MRHEQDLARLLRRAGRGGLTLAGAGALRLPALLLSRALSDGLLRQTGDRLALEEAGRSYLRRRASLKEEAFLEQHGAIVALDLGAGRAPSSEARAAPGPVAPARGERLRLNRDESPLSQLARLKDKSGEAFFPDAAIEAGERLLADFTRAGLQPRLTARLEPRLESRSSGGARSGIGDLTDAMTAGRIAFGRAVKAMGPELSGVAVDVCCFMKGLETVERERQWPVRSAKLMLRTALLALSRHYRPPPRPQMRRWSEDDGSPPPSGQFG